MLIDFHTHVFPDSIAKNTINILSEQSKIKPCFEGTVLGLEKYMENVGCDICVSLPVATKPSQFDSINKFAITLNERFSINKKGILSFGAIHPKCENIKQKMKFLFDNGIKGVKIHPDYQQTFIDDEGYIEILKSALDYDMIVVTHAGVDEGLINNGIMCPPDKLVKVIDLVKNEKFVLGHFGGNLLWKEVLDKLCDKNVYFDTAYTLNHIDKELFNNIISRHGADKILFASDCPWLDIKFTKDKIDEFIWQKEIKEKIFYKNAIKLLRLNYAT